MWAFVWYNKLKDEATGGFYDINTEELNEDFNRGYYMKKIKGIILASAILAGVGAFAYFKCSSEPSSAFEYTENETGITIKKYKGLSRAVTVPKKIDGQPVTEIGAYAFTDSSIKEVKLPDSVCSIGVGAFDNSSIEKFVFPNNVTEVSEDLFFGCTDLESVELPSHAGRIGSEAFMLCKKLKSIDIPDTVEEIGNSAFVCADALQEVKLPSGLKKMGNNVFEGTEYEKQILHDGFTMLSDSLLYKYQGDDEEIALPDNVKYVAGGAFAKCSASCIDVGKAEYIGSSAFNKCEDLKEVKLSERAELDGDYLFSGCTSLESVTLPYDCNIGNGMFSGCTSLKTVTMQGNVTVIGPAAFEKCTSLQSAELPDSLVQICHSVFLECTSLSSISLPEGLEKIGTSAFAGSGITEISIPQSITVIPMNCFSDCDKLTKAKFSHDTKKIEKSAFENCSALTDVNIPENIVTIEDKAFFASGIKKAILPDTLTSFGNSAFRQCQQLEELRLPSSLKAVPIECFWECTSLKRVDIPEGYTEVSQNAFYKCSYLHDVTLPDSLEIIGANAFASCNISAVFLPDSLSSFADTAFFYPEFPTTLCYTEKCKAADQIKAAQQQWLVHDGYELEVVADREEGEKIVSYFPKIYDDYAG